MLMHCYGCGEVYLIPSISMKQVAKVLIVDRDERYLLLTLNNHPRFHNDADLPGGTIDEGEMPLEAAVREVSEEVGIDLQPDSLEEVHNSSNFSKNGTIYVLYEARIDQRPEVKLSWEHCRYEWVDRKTMQQQAAKATDTYMHMVYAVLSNQE